MRVFRTKLFNYIPPRADKGNSIRREGEMGISRPRHVI